MEFKYKDGRKPDRKYMSPLSELRAICIHVPHTKKPGITVLKPVIDGVYINNDNRHSCTLTVMIVFDRVEAWYVYNKMSKCPVVWLYGHWISLLILQLKGPVTFSENQRLQLSNKSWIT